MDLVAKDQPIAKHYPVTSDCMKSQKTTDAVLVPDLSRNQSKGTNEKFEEWALDIYEWLSLVAIGSPRVLADDSVEPYLSRYQVPGADPENAFEMVALMWRGVIPCKWIRSLFIELR